MWHGTNGLSSFPYRKRKRKEERNVFPMFVCS